MADVRVPIVNASTWAASIHGQPSVRLSCPHGTQPAECLQTRMHRYSARASYERPLYSNGSGWCASSSRFTMLSPLGLEQSYTRVSALSRIPPARASANARSRFPDAGGRCSREPIGVPLPAIANACELRTQLHEVMPRCTRRTKGDRMHATCLSLALKSSPSACATARRGDELKPLWPKYG